MTQYLKIKLDDERELHITHYNSGGFSEDLQQAVLVHTQEGKNEVLTPITPSPLYDCAQQPVPQEADYPVEVPENGVERLTFVRYILNHVTDNADEVLARHAQEKQDEVHGIREVLLALVTDPLSDKSTLRSVAEELIRFTFERSTSGASIAVASFKNNTNNSNLTIIRNMKRLRNHEVAEQLGVTTQSVRRYANEGRLKCDLTPSGQRIFTQEYVDEFLGKGAPERSEKYAYYARSSAGDKQLIDSQFAQLRHAYGEPMMTYMDKSSGLNSKRKGLTKLLDDAQKGLFTHLAVTQKDRLSRFGVEFIERLLSDYGVTLIILHEAGEKSLHDELMQDFMSLIASFSGKFYRIRGYEQQRKLLNDAQQRLTHEE